MTEHYGPTRLGWALPGWADATGSVAHCITQIHLQLSRYGPQAGVQVGQVVGRSRAAGGARTTLGGEGTELTPRGAVMDKDLLA